MRVGIATKKQYLKKYHARGPHPRTTTKPRQDEFADDWLYLKQQKRTHQTERAEKYCDAYAWVGVGHVRFFCEKKKMRLLFLYTFLRAQAEYDFAIFFGDFVRIDLPHQRSVILTLQTCQA